MLSPTSLSCLAMLGAQVLKYHILQGEVSNSTLSGPPRDFRTLLANETVENTPDGGILDDTGKNATLLAADLRAVNGLVHVIDSVLEPYTVFTETPTAAPTAAPTTAATLNIVETLMATNQDDANAYYGMFDTLLSAIRVSGLATRLSAPGPYTVRHLAVSLYCGNTSTDLRRGTHSPVHADEDIR